MAAPARIEGEAGKAFSFRVTKNERAKIKESALLAGLSEGEYVRRAALGKRVVAMADTEALSQLRSLGGLLKHLHNQGIGHDEQTAAVLAQISTAISHVNGGTT